MWKLFIFPWQCLIQTSSIIKSHYYRLILLSINIDDNRSNHIYYEKTEAIMQYVRYSLQMLTRFELQQIILSPLILKFVNKY
jgi:hypothetical protein